MSKYYMFRFLNSQISIGYMLFIIFAQITSSPCNAQCPIPGSCTYNAVSGTNYSVSSGQVLCINSPTNYSSGNITLNGGTVYVANGATLGTNISTAIKSTVNNCGSIASGKQFENSITVNNYSSNAVSVDLSNGNGITLVNFSNNVNISITNPNANGASFTNNATGVGLNLSGSSNNYFSIVNSAGADLTVTSSITLQSGSTITNSGVLNWTSSFNTIGNNNVSFLNNKGAVFNSNNTGSSTINSGAYNNNGIMNFAGSAVFQGGAINNNVGGSINFTAGQFQINTNGINNYGTFTVYDFYGNTGSINMYSNSLFTITHAINTINNSFSTPMNACATVDLSKVGSIDYTSANNILTTSSTVNFCGKVPVNGSHQTLSVTNASNTSPITISYTSGGFTPSNGTKIYIDGVNGNTAANGYWIISNYNSAASTFDLVGSVGNGNYSASTATVYNNPALGSANYLGYSNCNNPCGPLAVTLIYLNTFKEGNSIKIAWATVNEINNSYFELERSLDGETFDGIYKVIGANNSSDLNSYSEIDHPPLEGQLYYRLKIVDNNGKTTFSKISTINFENNDDWAIYPNPSVDGTISITSHFTANAHTKITIEDITGKVVKNIDESEPSSNLVISDLQKGMYLVTVNNDYETVSKKVLVQ